MSRVTEQIYVGRDNVNALEFRLDGHLTQLDAITKIELQIPCLRITLIDDDPFNYPLKWMQTPPRVGVFEFKIGYELTQQPHVEKLVNGIHKSAFYIYGPGEPNGRHWITLWLDIDVL